jgi:hypothetical protein
MQPPTRTHKLAIGLIAACVVSVGLYGALRIVQAILFREADPATVVWSPHAGYFWRCWTVGYAGAMAGFLGYGAAGRSLALTCRGLLHALTIATLLIVAQGLLVP